MACDTPFDAFRMATESLGDDIYFQASFRDIAINLIPRTEFPRGIGLVQSTFTIHRSEPTDDEPEFDPITISDIGQAAGLCATTYQDVPVGFTERSYNPEKFGWKGPPICSDDLIYNFKAERFLSAYIAAIGKHTIRTIGNRLWAIYDHFVPKFVSNEDSTTVAGGTGAPPKSPDLTLPISTCHLDQSMLDAIAGELLEEGATDPDSMGWINIGEEGPIFPLYIGPAASKNLQLNNAELRQDYRGVNEGMMQLLKRVGATRVIGNFRHVINLFPPRYNYNGTDYLRVPTWLMPATTKGQGAVINPEWRAADFEGARVLSPWVYHDEVIRPVNSAAGLTFGAKNYVGDFQFVVGGDNISTTKCFDPLMKLGAHFAEFHHAPRPIHPEFGRLIIFKRCVPNFNCTTCS